MPRGGTAAFAPLPPVVATRRRAAEAEEPEEEARKRRRRRWILVGCRGRWSAPCSALR